MGRLKTPKYFAREEMIEIIFKETARTFRIPYETIAERKEGTYLRGNSYYNVARMAAILALLTNKKHGLPEIGRWIGMHHTSIMNIRDNAKKLANDNPKFKSLVDRLVEYRARLDNPPNFSVKK